MSMIFEASEDHNAFDLMSEFVASFLTHLGFSDATLLLKLSDPNIDDSILLESCWLENDMIIYLSDFWEGQKTIELFALIDDQGFYGFGYDFEEVLL